MFKDISQIIIEDIKEIIEQDNGCILGVEKSFQTYWLRSMEPDEGQEIEFRISRLGGIELLISRVCFRNRRNGTMTKILEVLKEYCLDERIQKIRIQSVETYGMMCFCIKNEMIPSPDNIWLDNVLIGDYDLEIIRRS